MHQRKYFTLNVFISEIISVEKFPNYGIFKIFKSNALAIQKSRFLMKILSIDQNKGHDRS